MSTIIARRFRFETAHRVLHHESKCKHLHGHSYVAWVYVRHVHDALDSLGRVVDFGIIKKLVGDFIDLNWDHNGIFHQDDPFLPFMHDSENRDPYVLNCNPTAENIAAELLAKSKALLENLGLGLTVVRVKVYETENCFAEVTES